MEEKTPLLSIVIPVYNVGRYVRRAAESVLKQPCADRIELLLVDDGSTDGSGAVCDQIAAAGKSPATIRVFHQENGGVSSARNLGIREARGEYLGFLDADDWWLPSFFDTELVQMLEEGFEVYQFSYLNVSPDCRWYKENRVKPCELRELSPGDDRPSSVTHWSCLYRRELLQRHRIEYLPCRVNEDVPFVHLALSLARSIKACDRLMLCYWSNPKSCLHTTSARTSLEESLRSLELEEAAYRERGVSISNDRVAVSILYTRLPRLCFVSSYRSLMQYLKAPCYDLLRQDEVKPWRNLQKQAYLFQKHPFLYWLKARLCEGIPLKFRSLFLAVPPFRRLTYFVQFRMIHKWKPMNKSFQVN